MRKLLSATLITSFGLAAGGCHDWFDKDDHHASSVSQRTTYVAKDDKDSTRETTVRAVSSQTPNALTESHLKQIKGVMADTVNAALTKGGLDNVAGYLAKEDRDRIGKYADNSYPDLDGRVEQILAAWKAKYGTDFDMSKDLAVFDEFRIAGDKLRATATVGKSGEMPEISLRLVNEGTIKNTWRIDIPDDISGQMFKDQMLAHVAGIADRTSAWPADSHEAYRMVARHVFDALNGTPKTYTDVK